MKKIFTFISSHSKLFLGTLLLIFLGLMLLSPSMLPAAIRTNLWSIKTLPLLVSGVDSVENITSPPASHPHGDIWMARLSLLSEKPQYASNLIEENDPQALQIDENDLQALDAKARSFYQQGQFTEAFAIWRKIGQKAALEEAAEQALEQGQTNLAIQAYQTAYQIDPEGYPLCL